MGINMNMSLKFSEFQHLLMTPSQPESFTPNSAAFCAERLKILANANRVAVLRLLLNGPKHVWELSTELQLEQSLLSHHLKTLRKCGFVEAHRDGKAMLYRIAPDVQSSSLDKINLGCCTISFHR